MCSTPTKALRNRPTHRMAECHAHAHARVPVDPIVSGAQGLARFLSAHRDGNAVGTNVSGPGVRPTAVGSTDGLPDGTGVGYSEGEREGAVEGVSVGMVVGSKVELSVGVAVGTSVGITLPSDPAQQCVLREGGDGCRRLRRSSPCVSDVRTD
jgi:hypothetical protein